MILKCLCGKQHNLANPSFAPAVQCQCGRTLDHSPSLVRCPWCNSPQYVEPKGSWRCPKCTGYWTYTLGAPLRRYGIPSPPYVLWAVLIFAALGALIIIAISVR